MLAVNQLPLSADLTEATRVDIASFGPCHPVNVKSTDIAATPTKQPIDAPHDGRFVRIGDIIILEVNADKYTFLHVKQSGTVRVGKADCSIATFIGAAYGSVYQLADDHKTLIRTARDGAETWAEATGTERSNASLNDAATNQTLTPGDVQALRDKGATGADIVAALAAGSSTFADKTEFSQEKYKKRKSRKYLTYVTVLRPTARSICEAIFSKSPQKTFGLRTDSLAIMLSLANIGAYAKVLVVDACSGLIAGAVAERLGGFGTACIAYPGRTPPSLDLLRNFNFSSAQKASVFCASIADLTAPVSMTDPTAETGTEPIAHNQVPGTADNITAASMVSAVSHMEEDSCRQEAAPSGAMPPVVLEPLLPQVHDLQATVASSSPTPVLTNPAIVSSPAVSAVPQPADEDPSNLAFVLANSGDKSADAAPVAPPGQLACEEVHHANSAPVTKIALVTAPLPAVSSLDGTQSAAVGALQPDTMPQTSPAVAPETVPSTAGRGGARDCHGGRGGQNGHLLPRVQQPQGLRMASAADLQSVAASGGFDCAVLVAPTLQPAAMLQQLLPLLCASAPFVAWQPHGQPLAEALVQLQATKTAVNLQLQESWYREHQVLPSRSHPVMVMPGTGGFLLSGITTAGSKSVAAGATPTSTAGSEAAKKMRIS